MAIFTSPGYPGANSIANGGKVYVYNNISTTPSTIAPANTQRQSITFHNPGDVDIYIGPALAYATLSATSPSALTPSTSALGGCFRVFGNGGTLTLTGECQGAWQAFSASSSSKPLTVMDSNV